MEPKPTLPHGSQGSVSRVGRPLTGDLVIPDLCSKRAKAYKRH